MSLAANARSNYIFVNADAFLPSSLQADLQPLGRTPCAQPAMFHRNLPSLNSRTDRTAERKGKDAMQRPLCLGSQPTLLSNLVAELRLPTGRLLMCCCIAFLALLIFVAQVSVKPRFSEVLTADMLNVDIDRNTVGDNVDVDRSTVGGSSALTNRLMERVLSSANREAEKAIGRVESLEQALKETLQPSDMIQRLVHVLTEDDSGDFKQSLDLHAVGANYVPSSEPNAKDNDPLRDLREFLLSND